MNGYFAAISCLKNKKILSLRLLFYDKRYIFFKYSYKLIVMEKKRILIVDDDNDLLSSLKIILEDRDFDVHTASTKKEGFDLLKSEKPDLLIQDIMMDSDLEGYGILNTLKSDPEFRKLPVIMLTGIAEAMEVNFRSAIEDDPEMFPHVVFLDKPVEPDVLFTEINTFLK